MALYAREMLRNVSLLFAIGNHRFQMRVGGDLSDINKNGYLCVLFILF